ncbi:MAG TPA: sulfatase-like hydrolase/transferase [Solirubrobacterales bacterium]|nr:sulfatase-like hydrolase/transferase [Solirubrobacterales bacterium]
MSAADNGQGSGLWPARAWAELAGFWALAIAWPVYQAIAAGPEALTGVGARRGDLVLVVVVVSLLVPTVLLLAELAVSRFAGERAQSATHALLLAAIGACAVWQWLVERDLSGLLALLGYLLAAAGIAALYLRFAAARAFAGVLALATPVVVAAFALSYPVSDEVLAHDDLPVIEPIEARTPVVLVVFDELPLAALLDERGEIDAGLFPHFARLAGTSTWYPNAVAVADQTTFAVPSILTGQDPFSGATPEPPPPGLPDYPQNVCTLARAGGYEVHAYEPVTDLCEKDYGEGTKAGLLVRRGVGSSGLPAEEEVALAPGGVVQAMARGFASLFPEPYSEYGDDRDEAIESFLDGMPREPRSLSVLHIALPHIDWQYLPDGQTYPTLRDPRISTLDSPPTRNEVNRDFQQMMIQLVYTDRQLGRVMRRVRADGNWADALFVVTADHGAAFMPGGSRRILVEPNAGWILPVPLLVKYPGQTRGRRVPGEVDSRDIAPTVLEALGVHPPEELDGRSLIGRRPDPVGASVTAKGVLIGTFEFDRAEVERRLDVAERERNALFGDRSFYALGRHEDVLGHPASRLTGDRPLPAEPVAPEPLREVDTGAPEIPAYYEASLRVTENPGPLAVAVNGRIAATARAWLSGGAWRVGVVLPPSSFRDGANRIQVYPIRR